MLKNKIWIFFLFFLVIIELALFSQEKYVEEYKIGPRDLLEISVYGGSNLNRTVRVSEDGKIKFPPLEEDVEVGGLTVAEMEKKLSEVLAEKYLVNPQVTVFIREHQSRKVSVLGAVAAPGERELLGRRRLLEIIAEVGGFTTDAGADIIIIRENQDGVTETLKVPKKDLILGDSSVNIPLKPGDVIYVLPDEIVHIYMTGQVRSPGVLEARKSNIPTLYRAIAQAGGFSDRASKGGVSIKRIGEDGKETIIKVNVNKILKGEMKDFPLKENDIIYVPATLF